MADGEQLLESVFELLDAGSRVRKPTAVDHIANTLQKAFFVTYVGATDVQYLFKAWLTAKYGEIIYTFLYDHGDAGLPSLEVVDGLLPSKCVTKPLLPFVLEAPISHRYAHAQCCCGIHSCGPKLARQSSLLGDLSDVLLK